MKVGSHKSIFIVLVAAVLLFCAFIPSLSIIPGKYLTADLQTFDLTRMASENPVVVWTVVLLLTIACAGYGLYYLLKLKKV